MTISVHYKTPDPPAKHTPNTSPLRRLWRKTLDRLTYSTALGGALLLIALLLGLFAVIAYGAGPAIQKFGLSFFVTSRWNPVKQIFGAWPMVYGTLVSSLLALLFAVPVSIGAAVFLVRLAPKWLATPASFLIELLAAIPSLAYGLWGAAVLVPWLQTYVQPFLNDSLGKIPLIGDLFQNAGAGYSLLAAGIILAIMVIPIITAIARDVLATVPPDLEQGAYGLGATWWQATKIVLSFARMGIFGAVILGLARALGETMAVTMVIGNTISKDRSLLAPGHTIASLLANQFREADTNMYTSALIYSALLLLLITVAINGLARVMILRVVRQMPGR